MARLTEARFTEATCGISCARFRALVRPKRAQASLRQEHTSAGQEFIENYMIFGINFHSLDGHIDLNPV